MSRIVVFHKACGGPALDQDDLDATHTFDFLTDELDFSLTCITCLDEITDRSELTTSEFLPSKRMHPVLIQFGPLAIRWYGVMYGIGIIIGGWLLGKEFRRKGIPLSDDERWNFLTLVFLSGILGARSYYVVFNWDFYSSHPAEIPAIWHGGLAIHGALIGGMLGGWWYVHRHRLSFLKLADAGAPSLILAQALGRIGNFMNGEIHGYPTSMPWGIVFPLESPAGQQFGQVPLHPAMLYEMVLNLLIFFFLWFIRKRPAKDGFIFSLYLILYSIDRSIVSTFRGEDLMIGPFRAPHVVSLIIVLFVGGYLIKKRLWKPTK